MNDQIHMRRSEVLQCVSFPSEKDHSVSRRVNESTYREVKLAVDTE